MNDLSALTPDTGNPVADRKSAGRDNASPENADRQSADRETVDRESADLGPTGATAPGKVWLVGAGPGAADLLTVRAVRALAQADIVLHDALVDPDVLALAPQAILVPVGKRCGKLSTTQRFINKRLVDAALRHRCVVRLKGGDPMLFGRAQEEIDALQAAGIDVEVVPGISAVFGASANLMQSLTQRGVSRNVILLTPRFGEGETRHDWARPAAAADTVVLYMASRSADTIREGLLDAGLPASLPAVVVENASLPGERIGVGRLGELPSITASLGDGPALLLIGAVFEAQVALRQPTVPSLRAERADVAAA